MGPAAVVAAGASIGSVDAPASGPAASTMVTIATTTTERSGTRMRRFYQRPRRGRTALARRSPRMIGEGDPPIRH